MSQAVVVLPLVPVMPTSVSAAEGAPKKRSAIAPSWACRPGTGSAKMFDGNSGARTPAPGSHRIARAPRSIASAACASPCVLLPAQARKAPPGRTSALDTVRSVTSSCTGTPLISGSSSASARGGVREARIIAAPPVVEPAPDCRSAHRTRRSPRPARRPSAATPRRPRGRTRARRRRRRRICRRPARR